jgi:dihydrolipoamide dehydrogenase
MEIKRDPKGLSMVVQGPKDPEIIAADNVLVSVGRVPNTEGLNLESLGLKMRGRSIQVDSSQKTSKAHIFSVGDCSSKIMLAHVASREGEIAAENIAGLDVKMDYKTTPGVVYTDPEVAFVGLTEKSAREKGYDVVTGHFPLMANGKCAIMEKKEGFIKIVSEREFGEILGVHILAPRASDMISEAGLALMLESTVDEIISTIHPHPTVSEGLRECAMEVWGRAISVPKK